MLKGLYDFTPISPKTLGFQRHEKLLYLASVERDENWLRVSNCKGQIGLVPINYVDVDRDVTGSAVVDFLDESLQVSRRGGGGASKKFFSELQEIRRNILNPINDLERRLFEFQDVIDQLKAKGSPFCHHRGGDTKSAVSITDSPSYMTLEEAEFCSNNSNNNRNQQQHGDTSENHNNYDNIEVKSGRTMSSTYIQFVNSEHDNESQPPTTYNNGSEGWCSNKSNNNNNNSHNDNQNNNNNSEFDKKSISGHTYTCSPSSARNNNNHKTSTTLHQNNFVPSPSLSCTINCCREPSKNSGGGSVFGGHQEKNLITVERNRNLCELIDNVRQTAGLSHDMSRKAVETVLRYLQDLHHVKGDSESNIELFLDALETKTELHKSPSFIVRSADYEKLQLILTELRVQAKDDENWILQDDEGTCRLLEEMNIILREADARVVIKSLDDKDDYQNVHSLVLYYQKEHRWPRRQLLIKAFTTIATIDLKALSVLVNSILPLELAREMMTTSIQIRSSLDRQKLESIGNLLWLLLSTGEKLPVTHFEFLGRDFLDFVFDKIENSSSANGNEDEHMSNVFINLILAYNLQFGFQDENLTIATLATRQNAKFLTQKSVHLLLWDEDPIQLQSQDAKCPNSVLKLVMEMFSCAKIADLFYTNDVKVLIDIVIRSLMDWEPGEKKRTLYLQLIRMIIRNSNFREHNHRRHDLVKIFTLILLEEDPLAVPDQRLVREISNEFPTLIK